MVTVDVEEGNRSDLSQDLDMFWEIGGWNFFRYSFEQLQFQSLYNWHCFIIEEQLAQKRSGFWQSCPSTTTGVLCTTAVHRILNALSRHLKQEEVTNMKKSWSGTSESTTILCVWSFMGLWSSKTWTQSADFLTRYCE